MDAETTIRTMKFGVVEVTVVLLAEGGPVFDPCFRVAALTNLLVDGALDGWKIHLFVLC